MARKKAEKVVENKPVIEEYEVIDRYKKCSEIILGYTLIPIVNGKVKVNESFRKALDEGGFLK